VVPGFEVVETDALASSSALAMAASTAAASAAAAMAALAASTALAASALARESSSTSLMPPGLTGAMLCFCGEAVVGALSMTL